MILFILFAINLLTAYLFFNIMTNMNSLNDLIIKDFCAANRVNVKINESLSKKNRERFAIAIKTKGKTIYSSQEKEYVSDEHHIMLLPKGSSYKLTCINSGECLMIEFLAEDTCLPFMLKSYKVHSQKEFIDIFCRLEKYWTFKKPSFKLNCLASLYTLLAKLDACENTPYNYSNKYDIISESIKYLEEHYNEPDLTNETLAKISRISTVYFRKIFCGIYNISPMHYLQKIRLDKAKNMLISDYVSIESIASAVGYKSLYYFSKSFKNYTGYSPTEYSRLSLRT